MCAAQNGIAGPLERLVKVTATEFGAMASSKTEVYRFLAAEVGAFLDTYQTMTVWHLRDIMSGKRKMIKSADVKHIFIPQFERLSTADLLEWAKKYPTVYQALPVVESEIEMLHRQYIANLIYTLVGEPFQDWVDVVLKKRSKRLADERNLNINLDPEIARIFKASTTISCK